MCELKEDYQSYRKMAFLSGISVKTIHGWCAEPKDKIHKSKEMSNLRRKKFENFLLQDTISFAHPCKKYAGKHFLRDMLEVTRTKYLQQSEFHKNGIISMSCMKQYHPSYIMLCGKIPLDQCLCDKCENCEQLLKALTAVGMKNVPSNRYAAVDAVVCADRVEESRTRFSYARKECLFGSCANCGELLLEENLRNSNLELFCENKNMTWRKWTVPSGRLASEKCQIKGTI